MKFAAWDLCELASCWRSGLWRVQCSSIFSKENEYPCNATGQSAHQFRKQGVKMELGFKNNPSSGHCAR